jgi:hypothetical protein
MIIVVVVMTIPLKVQLCNAVTQILKALHAPTLHSFVLGQHKPVVLINY